MLDVVSVIDGKINTMTTQQVDKVYALEKALLEMPQVELPTKQIIHGGMYARNMFVAAGVTVTGALMRVPTILIISGHMLIYIGDDTVRFEGYHIITAGADRKQAGYAIEDTNVTMLFPTKAKTIEEAELEFTAEVDKLMSRNGKSRNETIVTGE